MNRINIKSVSVGLAIGIGATGFVGTLPAQQAGAQPVKSETQSFVTGEGDHSRLWVADARRLRVDRQQPTGRAGALCPGHRRALRARCAGRAAKSGAAIRRKRL